VPKVKSELKLGRWLSGMVDWRT